jgi:hypothetical protein
MMMMHRLANVNFIYNTNLVPAFNACISVQSTILVCSITLEEAGNRKEAKRLRKGEDYDDVVYVSYVFWIHGQEEYYFCEL